MEWYRRLCALFRRKQFEQELDEEIAFHLTMKREHQAEREAAIQFGNTTRVREECRSTWGWESLDQLFQDVRQATRSVLSNRAFTVAIVATLALGTGANTTIFSAIYAYLLRPLPYHEPERLVVLTEHNAKLGIGQYISWPDYVDWRNENTVFSQIGAFDAAGGRLNWSGFGDPQFIRGRGITADLIDTLGVRPIAGRKFTAEEDKPGAPRRVLLGELFWRTHFGARTDVIGHTMTLDNAPAEIIGVMPASFRPANAADDLFYTLRRQLTNTGNRGGLGYRAIARLKDHTSIKEAASQIGTITDRVHAAPEYMQDWHAVVEDIHTHFYGRTRGGLMAAWAALVIVLLIACANVSSLLLARATARHRELAIRVAIGAGRMRLLRYSFLESAVLFMLGGLLGILVAVFCATAINAWTPEVYRPAEPITVGGPVLLFALGVTIATALLAGCIPAVRTASVNPQDAMRAMSHHLASGRNRTRQAIVAGQIALSAILLFGAALLARSMVKVLEAPLGYEPENVVSMLVALPSSTFPTSRSQDAFYERLLAEMRRLPDVAAAGGASALPLQSGADISFQIEGKPDENVMGGSRIVTPGYFKALGRQMLRGRDFDARDGSTAPEPRAIINATMAATYWPGQDPIGKRFRMNPTSNDQTWYRVVGVVADIKHFGPEGKNWPEWFIPHARMPRPALRFAIRTTRSPEQMMHDARALLRQIGPQVALSDLTTLDKMLAESTGPRRIGSVLAAGFAAVALLLTAVGLYGTISYAVVQRRKEIAVRIALGAQPRDVIAIFSRRTSAIVGIGAAGGVLGCLALRRILEAFLFGTEFSDGASALSVITLLGVVSALATIIPVRRALHGNPVTGLYEL